MSTSAGQRRLPSSRPPANLVPGKEFDGGYLHAAVAQESSIYKYKQDLSTEISSSGGRTTFGNFTCRNHRSPRTWSSGKITTEIFVTSDDRYRTILHAQQCRGCEKYVEPEIDEESYAKKVTSTLDLWTKRREKKYDEPGKDTPPHDRRRCHGCQIGVCSQASREDTWV